MKVGDKVRLPEWEDCLYIEVKHIGITDNGMLVCGVRSWDNKSDAWVDYNWDSYTEPEQPLYLYRWQDNNGNWWVTDKYYSIDDTFRTNSAIKQYHRIEESKFVPPNNEE